MDVRYANSKEDDISKGRLLTDPMPCLRKSAIRNDPMGERGMKTSQSGYASLVTSAKPAIPVVLEAMRHWTMWTHKPGVLQLEW